MATGNTDFHVEKNGPQHFAERVRLNQRKLASDLKSHYDFIVCGAGTSGSVVAARLAADPNTHVLPLEFGHRRLTCFHIISENLGT